MNAPVRNIGPDLTQPVKMPRPQKPPPRVRAEFETEPPRRGLKLSGMAILGLLALLVVGDQIRLRRPDHKFRLLVEVDTPSGVKSGASVLSVTPNRSYGGSTSGESAGPQTKGDAVFVDLGEGRNLVALLAVGAPADVDAINYLAMRSFTAAGRRVQFRDMKKTTAMPPAPVTGDLVPVLMTFKDVNDPKSAELVTAANIESVLGAGIKLRDITVVTVTNGFWPLDVGGVLGTPVSRGIEQQLPWLKGDATAVDQLAAAALSAAGVKLTRIGQIQPGDAKLLFER
jgi:hypothetical protein